MSELINGILGFSHQAPWLRGKESAWQAGDVGSIPVSISCRSPGEGNGNPFHYSCLWNPYGQKNGKNANLISGLVSWWRIRLQCRRPWFNSWVGKICWKDRLPTPLFGDFPDSSAGKESTCKEGDLGLIPGLGRFPGEGKGYPLQYSGLEKSMDCTGHGVAKNPTQLSNLNSFLGFSNLMPFYW